MTDLAKTLADLAAKATPGAWEVEIDPYGNPFPGITEAGSPFELASFTAGECADKNQANAELSVLLHNNLPAIIARIDAEALARGRMEGAKAMQEAVILKLDECCEPCFQCNQNVTALDPAAIVKGLNDAD